MKSRSVWPIVAVGTVLALAPSCGGATSDATPASASTTTNASADAPRSASSDGLFPDVVEVVADQAADGTWSFDVTLSSPYDSPERYADAWRVLTPDGDELGVRELTHDHANEQPFTRSLTGVTVPDGVTEVTIEGRDQINGWGGNTLTITLG